MKKTEIGAKVQSGEIIVVAEWRSAEGKTNQGTDTKGKPYDIRTGNHNVEIGGKPYTISESLAAGTDTEKWKAPFKKGDMVVGFLDLTEGARGAWRVRGKFELLTD